MEIDKGKFSEAPDFAPPPSEAPKRRGRPPRVEPDAPVSAPVPILDEEMKLGRPLSSFTASELSYINDREADFLEHLQRDKTARPLVNEVIVCDIEMQRVDRKIAELQQDGLLTPELIAKISVYNEHRATYMRRYREALEMLGAVPKDQEPQEEDLCLSGLHKRYLAALNERKRRGDRVGHPSKEEAALAKAEGLDHKRYVTPGVMEEGGRAEILARQDAPSGETSQ